MNNKKKIIRNLRSTNEEEYRRKRKKDEKFSYTMKYLTIRKMDGWKNHHW